MAQKKASKRPSIIGGRLGISKGGTSKISRRVTLIIVLGVALIAAAIGVYYLWFAAAAPNNCQPENGFQICDVDMTLNPSDSVLSISAEAQYLAGQGWGNYYGAVFRAPTAAYNGAVPIHRVVNSGATYHDWVTDQQKADKEAKYGAQIYEGVAFFAWTDGRQPGTVPVYRLTRGGADTQTFFTTDRATLDWLLASGGGWKIDDLAPSVAFWAFPPSYAVAGLANPYDCSVLENYTSERCQPQRENLDKAVNEGKVPTANECPKTAQVYIDAPLKGEFPQECQTFWNAYIQDCSIAENFTSDRCKAEREAVAKAAAEQIRLRQEAAAKAQKTPRGSRGGGTATNNNTPDVFGPTGVGAGGAGTSNGSTGGSGTYQSTGAASTDGSYIRGTCTITYKMDQFWGFLGSTSGKKVYKNKTRTECDRIFAAAKNKTIDGMNRKHYGYQYSWVQN